MRYTKEQMEVLKEYENNFYTAIHSGYIRNITASKMDLIEATTGEKCSNRSCSHCVLSFIRQVGTVYYATKESMVEDRTEPTDAPKTSMEVIDKMIESDPELKQQVKDMIMATNKEQDEPKPKRGRPKKQTS